METNKRGRQTQIFANDRACNWLLFLKIDSVNLGPGRGDKFIRDESLAMVWVNVPKAHHQSPPRTPPERAGQCDGTRPSNKNAPNATRYQIVRESEIGFFPVAL
jgi:hypothetical protein